MESTANKPIRFFINFFNSNSLENLKIGFYPNKDNEFDTWNKYPYEIDLTNESFTIEYQAEVNTLDYNTDDWMPVYEWKTKRIIFSDYLDEYLKHEFRRTVDYLEQNINNRPNKNKAKYFVGKIIYETILLLQKINEDPFKKYPVCQKPLKAIIRYLYKEYSDLVPKADKEVKNILLEKDSQINHYKPNRLQPGIARDLIDLRDHATGERVFFKEEISDNERRNLISFIQSDFEAMTQPIDIQNNFMAFHYLLREMSIRGDAPHPRTIMIAKKIKFKGKDFEIDNHNTNYQRFKNSDSPLKTVIDQMISAKLV